MIGFGIPGLGFFSEKECRGNVVFATFLFSVATDLMLRTGCLKVLGLCGASGVLDFSTFILLGDGEAIPIVDFCIILIFCGFILESDFPKLLPLLMCFDTDAIWGFWEDPAVYFRLKNTCPPLLSKNSN